MSEEDDPAEEEEESSDEKFDQATEQECNEKQLDEATAFMDSIRNPEGGPELGRNSTNRFSRVQDKEAQ